MRFNKRPWSETFRRGLDQAICMSSRGENNPGLMSSAGLVRYFDAEGRNAPTMDPKTLMAFSVLFGVFVQILNVLYL